MSTLFHKQLRNEREKRGWSRNYVAEQVEVDVATVGRWERGERLPYPHYRQKICALFELSAQEMGLYTEAVAKQGTTIALETSEKPIDARPIPTTPIPELPKPEIPRSEIPIQEQDNQTEPQPFFRSRRKMLVSLGGIGIAALVFGGAKMITTHSLARPSTLAAAPVALQPLARLLDPNTTNWVNNLAWSPNQDMLIAANDTPKITLWDVTKNAISDSYPTLDKWVNDVAWSPTNQIAIATAGSVRTSGDIQIWAHPEIIQPSYTLHRTYAQRTVSWSPDGEYLASAGHQTMVELWGPSANPVSRYLYTHHDSIGINRVKWSPDATHLAAAADDGTVYVWEIRTGNLKISYRGHQKRVVDLVWSPDGANIASASVDYTAQTWSAMTGKPGVVYRGHQGEVHGIDWSPDGKYVVSASYDTTAQVWSALTGQHVTTYGQISSKLLCVVWSFDGKTLAIGSQKNGIEIWQAPT